MIDWNVRDVCAKAVVNAEYGKGRVCCVKQLSGTSQRCGWGGKACKRTSVTIASQSSA